MRNVIARLAAAKGYAPRRGDAYDSLSDGAEEDLRQAQASARADELAAAQEMSAAPPPAGGAGSI
jgi:hypothetical protein